MQALAHMSKPFVMRWGIVGSGSISAKFVKDLGLDPSERGCNDVQHALVAVGARKKSRAEQFITDSAPKGAYAQQSGAYSKPPKAVGGYESVYNDPDVHIVYIGTVHTQHFDNAKAALEAGKGVLVEKPATLNRNESKILIDLAKERNLFFMEGVWTRFFPLVARFQELLHKERVIGDVHNVLVDFGVGFYNSVPETHRVFNPELGGSAQLDIGPYSLLWGLLALQEHPENKNEPPAKIFASSLADPRTGVDLFTTVILDYPKMKARANRKLHLSCNNMVTSSPQCCVRVMGTEGELLVGGAVAARPEYLILRKYNGKPPVRIAEDFEDKREDFPLQGTGLNHEADAVARAVRDGQTFCEKCPPETTLLTMGILDEWRKQVGHQYPAGQEKA